MRKVIRGKRYDTDAAREIATWTRGSRRDFAYVEETLYRKRTGEYFVWGAGGPETRYAERVGLSSWQGGEAIVPLTYEEARQWMEEKATADEYEAEFGEIGEGGDAVTISVRVSEGAKAKLAREAARTGETQSEIVERLISTL